MLHCTVPEKLPQRAFTDHGKMPPVRFVTVDSYTQGTISGMLRRSSPLPLVLACYSTLPDRYPSNRLDSGIVQLSELPGVLHDMVIAVKEEEWLNRDGLAPIINVQLNT